MRIAVLEDDPVQAETVLQWLKDMGHDVKHYPDNKSLLRSILHESFDMLIFDWMLPDGTGEQTLKILRQERKLTVPTIFVTSRDSEEDIIHALDIGADDYIVKPLRRLEFLSRIEAIHRRTHPNYATPPVTLEVGDFVIDTERRSIHRSGQLIELTEKEFQLANFLFQNLGRLLSRGHILETVWGHSNNLQTRTLDTHISRIRNKLVLRPENGFRLGPIYSYGYRLEKL